MSDHDIRIRSYAYNDGTGSSDIEIYCESCNLLVGDERSEFTVDEVVDAAEAHRRETA